VLVYGLGRSGGAVSRLLRRQGHEVLLFDRAPDGAQLAELIGLGCRPVSDVHGSEAELCVAAPGVAWDHPDLAALRARGLETIGEVEWVYRTISTGVPTGISTGIPTDFVGVTGTAGKGTVTRWLTVVLERAGIAARAGGNIDPALAEVAEAGVTLVTELSSFMLERCPTLKPRVAVILNLGVDHLDRHGSVAAYHAAKGKLLDNLDETSTFVYNADDPILPGWAAACPAHALGYSLEGPAQAHLQGGWLHLRGVKLVETGKLRLRGSHNHGNALAVALAAAALGLNHRAIAAGLPHFGGLPGRYSLIGKVGGVSFVEDSIATRGLAVRAALASTPAPIVWIGGGLDKGADFEPLEGLVRAKVALFIGVGAAGPAFAERLGGLTRTLVMSELSGREALRRACAEALAFCRAEGLGGATVLFSPLAASFDQFRDYAERARVFREVVASLGALRENEEAPAWT
jgi:UDP-N-acetylmuramoylalanine--D-glutamate ligase